MLTLPGLLSPGAVLWPCISHRSFVFGDRFQLYPCFFKVLNLSLFLDGFQAVSVFALVNVPDGIDDIMSGTLPLDSAWVIDAGLVSNSALQKRPTHSESIRESGLAADTQRALF